MDTTMSVTSFCKIMLENTILYQTGWHQSRERERRIDGRWREREGKIKGQGAERDREDGEVG